MSNRANIEPILEAIPAARQEDARHYGVHPYFTRRQTLFGTISSDIRKKAI